MKYIFSLLLLSLFFVSCDKKQEVKSVTTTELKALLGKEKIQLLDVRTPDEIGRGFIKTAIFVNYFDTDFYAEVSKKLDKSKPVYVYCKTGGRSGKAVKILREKGYDAYSLSGGYVRWKKIK